MNETKRFEVRELTQEEKERILKEFKQLLAERSDFISVVNNGGKNLNLKNECCYISSGDIIGVYFPNLEFEMSRKNTRIDINFVCIGVNKETSESGLIYNINYIDSPSAAINGDYFESFDELLTTYEEREIRKKINQEIKRLNEELRVLKSIKRVTKKDGKDFQNLSKNFIIENGKINCQESYNQYNVPECRYNASIKLYKYNFGGYADNAEIDIYKIDKITADDVSNQIKLTIENREKQLKEYERKLNNLHSTIKLIETKCRELAEALKPTGLGWNMCEILEGLTYRYLNK